ncbi:MAG: ABC transporter permease, partial [Pedobacter sp.]
MNSNSPSKKIWNRFKRNKLAFGGLLFILLLMVMGILGYLITPDQTPYANTMHLQLSNKKPFRTFDFLIINQSKDVKQVNLFSKMLYGQEASFKSVPITSFRLKEKEVLVREYIGDDEVAEETAYEIKQICGSCELDKDGLINFEK